MDEICCPVCGQNLCWLDEVYRREESRTVAGCSRCLCGVDAYEWAEGEMGGVNGRGPWPLAQK